MAVRTDFAAGEVLAAADLNDTFGAKLNLAGGKILQIVRATDGTNRTTTSTSFVDVTGMTVSITPTLATSNILIICHFSAQTLSTSGPTQTGRYRLVDNSGNSMTGTTAYVLGTENNSFTSSFNFLTPVTLIAWNSPATTSSVNYKMQMLSVAATTTTSALNGNAPSQLFAIEVSA